MSDSDILGGAGGIEEVASRPEDLQGEVEGLQLAWFYFPGFATKKDGGLEHVDIGCPDLWEAVALEFTNGSKMLIFAAPVGPEEYPPYRTIVLWRWFEKITWATKKQLEHLRGYTDVPMVHPIQQWLHGAVCRGVTVAPQPNEMGGQDVTIEFSSGRPMFLDLRARRRAERLDPQMGGAAAFTIRLRKTSGIIMPGV